MLCLLHKSNSKDRTKFSLFLKVKFKRFSSKVIAPSLATPGSACFDLHSVEDVLIEPHSCYFINTDIAIAIPKSYIGKIHARSSWEKRFTSVLR